MIHVCRKQSNKRSKLKSSTTYVSTSCITDAGKGVFTNKIFKKNDIVTFFCGRVRYVDSKQLNNYEILVEKDIVIDPIDANGRILRHDKYVVDDFKSHGSLANEPPLYINMLNKKNTVIKSSMGNIQANPNPKTNVYPNVILYSNDEETIHDVKNRIAYVPLRALRRLYKNEEIFLCYSPTYEDIRKRLGYVSTCSKKYFHKTIKLIPELNNF